MRVSRILAVFALATGALLAAAPAASAAPDPCVTIYSPTQPGYAAPTCLSSLIP